MNFVNFPSCFASTSLLTFTIPNHFENEEKFTTSETDGLQTQRKDNIIGLLAETLAFFRKVLYYYLARELKKFLMEI